MDNTTSSIIDSEVIKRNDKDLPRIFERSWVFAQVFNAIFLIGTVWNFFGYISYGVKHNKWRRTSEKCKKNFNMLALAALCPFLLILRLLGTEGLILVDATTKNGEKGNKLCEVVFDFSIVMFSVASLPVYIFLWYRQRMLYSQASLKRLNTKKIRFFSNLFIVLIFLGGGSSCFINTIPVSYKFSEIGCIRRPDGGDNVLASYITAATLVTSQAILFALFVHPLRMHRTVTGVNLSTAKQQGKKSTSELMYRKIKSAFVSTVICIASDLVALVMYTMVLPKSTPLTLTRSIYDMSLFVNLVSVLTCFEHSKEIVSGVCASNKISKVNSSYRSTRNVAVSGAVTSSFL